MSDEKACSCESGTCAFCPDEDAEDWIPCPEPPAEAYMVDTVIIKTGHGLKELVDVSVFPPLINEKLYEQIMKMYPKDGVLFTDGTGSGAEMTREVWKEVHGADPMAQIAWQRRDNDSEPVKLSGKGGKNQAGRLKIKF